ncbi:MAG: hypothetical protein NVS3B10_20700 [Polyangiales bacterium]
MSFARTALVLLLSSFSLVAAGCGSSDPGGGTTDDDTGVATDDTGAGGSDTARDTADARPADTGGGGDTNVSSDPATGDTATADSGTGDTGAGDTGAADTGPGDVATDTGTAETADAPAGTIHEVKVGPGGTFTFASASLTIPVGDTVRWTWSSSSHSVTSGAGCIGDGKFDSTVLLSGATFSHTFDTAGAFPYFCSVHCAAGMVGTVTVTP